MVKINLNYEGDLQFKAVHGPSQTHLMTDAPVDNQGKGRSFSPSDLVATALGTCMGTIMGIVAKRDNINLSGMTISVEKEMTSQPVRRIGSLKLDIKVPNILTEDEKKKLKNAAETCPVHKSLHPDIKVNLSYTWG